MNVMPSAVVPSQRLARLLFSAAFVLTVTDVRATSQTWNGGAGNGNWTANNNWSSNTTYPQADETATFNGAGATQTNISVAGVSGIKYITFDGTGVAEYRIGTEPSGSQTLILRNDGVVRMSPTCRSNQFINARLQLGPDKASASYTFQNDNAQRTLTFLGDIGGLATSGTAGDKSVYFKGSGPLTFLAPLTRANANNLDFYHASSSTVTLSGTNVIRYLRLRGDQGSTLWLNEGALLLFTNSTATSLGGENISSTTGGTIAGPGAIQLSSASSSSYSDNGVAPGASLTIASRLTGPGGFEVYHATGRFGTIILDGANDFLGNVTIAPVGNLRARKFGNSGATDSNLGAGSIVYLSGTYPNQIGLPSVITHTGPAETSDRAFQLRGLSEIEQAGTGHLVLTAPFSATTATTLTLSGSTDGTGEIAGVIPNYTASSKVSVAKAGTGRWTLSALNTFTGNITVFDGTLAITAPQLTTGSASLTGGILELSGAGALHSLSQIAANSDADGTLVIRNTPADNAADRVGDAIPINLNGGNIRFEHPGGAADYAETLGPVKPDRGLARFLTSRAAPGRTSTLTLSLATRNYGTLDFSGPGLGNPDRRNRILITGQAEGPLPAWITVSGAPASYSASVGVYADPARFTDIPARGPSSTLPNNANAAVRINTPGESGPIALAAATTAASSLTQATATPATVGTAGKTLRLSSVTIAPGSAALTLGAIPGDGELTSTLSGNQTLTLANFSGAPLTVNAALNQNGFTGLVKTGPGPATLAAPGNITASVFIDDGTLILANSNAIAGTSVCLTGIAPVFDASETSRAFTFGNLAGRAPLALADTAGNPVTLTTGNPPLNNNAASFAGPITGPGALVRAGTGLLTLTTDNTYTGGTTILPGALLQANSPGALGTGPVRNDGTLTLGVGSATYTGLDSALTGSGTNDVRLAIATANANTTLTGDHSAFTGLWRIGFGAPAGVGKVIMDGPDNPAARIIVGTNATLATTAAGTHSAALTLLGGNTGESYGQLRLDGDAVWAGPVTFGSNPMESADAYFGANSGNGTLSGQISDNGTGAVFSKDGGSRLYLRHPANTFAGPVWIKRGWLHAASIGNAGQASSLGAGTEIRLGNGGTTAGLLYDGPGETTDRAIVLAATTATTYIEHNGTGRLTLTGGVTPSGNGSKTFQLQGTSTATGELACALADYPGQKTHLTKNSTATWTLSAASAFTGDVTVNDGILRISHPQALGAGTKTIKMGSNANNASGRYVLDGAANGDIAFPASFTFNTSNQRTGAILNESGNNTILGPLNLISGDGDTALVSLAGKLTLAGAITAPTDTARILRLWGNGDFELSGTMTDGATTTGLPIIKESNSGTLTLSGTFLNTGRTSADGGTVVLSGSHTAAGITILNGATLVLTNAPSANSPNRLADLALAGSLRFAHPGGDADYAEALSITLGGGTSAIETSRADPGRTSALTLAALNRPSGGSLAFSGDGLGDPDNRNRVLITGQPDGPLPAWLTVNGSPAAYSASLGVHADLSGATVSHLAARGPDSVVPNLPAQTARITAPGTDGPVTLEAAVTTVAALVQDTDTPAVVSDPLKTLKADILAINPGKAALSIEAAALSPATAALTLANLSGAPLTVSAPVTNGAAFALAKTGPGPVILAGPAAHAGPTHIDAGELTLAADADQTLAAAVSGSGTLVKEGSGTLRLAAAANNTLFSGTLAIRNGTVLPQASTATFGSTNGPTVISGSGTLDVGVRNASVNTVDLKLEPVIASGAGREGQGAIVNGSAVGQYNALRRLTLAGDTTIGGTNAAARIDIRQTDGAWLDMGGHTLTKTGANAFGITGLLNVRNPGHFAIQQGSLRIESASNLGGGTSNTLTVHPAGALDYYNITPNPIAWAVTVEDQGRLLISAGNTTNINRQTGPVTLAGGTARVVPAGAYTLNIEGDIAGPGKLFKEYTTGTLVLSGTNTYEGGTEVQTAGITTSGSNSSWLWARHAFSLPGYGTPGKLTVQPNACLRVFAGDGTNTGWNAGQLNALHLARPFMASNSVFAIDTTDADLHGLAGLTDLSLYKYGSGTLTVTGTNRLNVNTSSAWGNMIVYDGRLVLDAASDTRIGAVTVTAGGTFAVNGPLLATNTSGNAIQLGSANGDRARAVVNADVTAFRFYTGNGTGASGATIQNGGTVDARSSNTAGTEIFSVGRSGAYGYYRLNNGTVNAGQIAVGGGAHDSSGTYNIGVIDIFGGDMRATSTSGAWLLWGWVRSHGVANVYGGTLATVPGNNPMTLSYAGDYGNFAMLNLLGPSAYVDAATNSASRAFEMARQGGNLLSVVNLNGGTLRIAKIQATSKTTPTHFNFNGGTLLNKDDNSSVAATFLQGLTRATVYPGGARFCISNVNCTVNQPLLAPEGWGLAAIPVADPGAGYIGAPLVMISGGSGDGATAVAQVDTDETSPTFGGLTGILVTSPGSGYQPGDALTVSLLGGGSTASAVLGAPRLAANVSGGLVKSGNAALTLGGANTFTGPVVVKEGTLILGTPAALAPECEIVLDGGALDLGGLTVTNAVSGAGTVANGTLYTVVSPAGDFAVGTETLTLSSAALRGEYRATVAENGASDLLAVSGPIDLSLWALVIPDLDPLDRSQTYTLLSAPGAAGRFASANLPAGPWHLSYKGDGTVALIYSSGTRMLLK
jgi:autotransporter-associated beta strand protein